MAEPQHATEPGRHCRILVDQWRGHRGAAQEPQRVGHGEVGQRRLAEQEVALLTLELLLQTAHQHRPLVQGLLQRQAAGSAATEQPGAVGQEALDRLGRQLGEAHGHRLRLEYQAHRMLEHQRVGPLGEAGDIEFLAFGQQRRHGFFRLQTPGDQRGVAIDVGSDLQHRGLAVAAGQGGQIRFGHHRGDQHRAPGQLLEAQHQTRLLGKRRGRVMVQDQLVHDRLRNYSGSTQLTRAVRCGLPTQPDSAPSATAIRLPAATSTSLAGLPRRLIARSRRNASPLPAQASM
ncbi:hypothetical protein D3C85_756720 [compost metagenome]